ncbi:calcium and integrin-binding family member 2 isoform X3 [Drosophila mauritiana]|uniref:Calcium and integrin-binding family member 2 isoform X3 n=1 Tax=Drosophila mauritiana TaxID=7226 RepID=A0A6P8J9N1_DROMA|nr:calcium and integrin-binding family member 2 isoform X3 [Drosophila mauritiana]
MGNKVVTFTEQELDDYQDCTFFTRKEILRVHKRFRELRPDLVPRQMTEGQASSVKVPCECIEKMPELRENPFRRRICEAFSRDGQGNLSFEDFLDALSVFSEQAPRDIKVFYAFKIYAPAVGQHFEPLFMHFRSPCLLPLANLPSLRACVCVWALFAFGLYDGRNGREKHVEDGPGRQTWHTTRGDSRPGNLWRRSWQQLSSRTAINSNKHFN